MSKSHKEYEVEKILDKREKPQLQYKVKWQNWSLKDATWEPIEHLTNVLDLVHEYEQSLSANSEKKKRIIGRKRKDSFILLSSDESDSVPKLYKKTKKFKRDVISSGEKEESQKFKKSKKKEEDSDSEKEVKEKIRPKIKPSNHVSPSPIVEKTKKKKVYSASESSSEEEEKPVKRGRPKKIVISESEDSESEKKVKKATSKTKKTGNEVESEKEPTRTFLVKSEKPVMIVTARSEADNKIAVKVKLSNDSTVWVFTDVLAKTHPKLLISYYESNLKFSK
jgi:hypothetical protein